MHHCIICIIFHIHLILLSGLYQTETLVDHYT